MVFMVSENRRSIEKVLQIMCICADEKCNLRFVSLTVN